MSDKTPEQLQQEAEDARIKADEAEHAAKTIPQPEPGPLDRTRVSREKSDEVETTTLPVVEVLIERSNNEKVSAEVFECEVPILQAIHTEMAVVVGDHVYDAEYRGDANDLFRSFQRKYNSPQAGQVVERVYRNARELSDETGLQVGAAKQAPASANVDNRRTAAKKPAKKAAKKR